MIYKREIFDQIKKHFDNNLAVVITGIRRSGKTSLLKYIFESISSKNKIFIDLENPLNQLIFKEKNYETIKENLKKQGVNFDKKAYLFLDEVQYLKNLPSIVKYFVDHYQSKFFLTGSASFYLKNLFSESLVGRKIIFDLYPLNFKEFLVFKEKKLIKPDFSQSINESAYLLFQPYINEYLSYGGFPEVVLAKDKEEKTDRLKDIFTSYFQKEINQFSDFRKTDLIRDLIILLAQNNGNILNIERIANDLKVSRLTIEEWIYFLKNTYFFDLISPFSANKRTIIRKAKKIYFVDWGLANVIASQTEGQILENCFYHLLKTRGEIFYYRKKSRAEIDFILKEENKIFSFEVKTSFYSKDYFNLKRLSEELKIKNYFLLLKNYCEKKDVKAGYIFYL